MIMSALLQLIIHLMITLTLVKLIFFRGKKSGNEDATSWKSAVDSMTLMESRLEQLQVRDIRQQERIWALEDQNRDLQQRVTRLTKELLLARSADAEPEPMPVIDDEDDDRHDAIPVN